MGFRATAVLALAMTFAGSAAVSGEQPAGPFVTVYHDDAVAFQVRRDRIKPLGDDQFTVWLRWLFATPQPWKSGEETSRIAVTTVDCARVRVRELAVLHRDRDGKLFDEEEMPDTAVWQSFEPDSGAAAAITRLCEFVPELLAKAGTTPGRKH